MVSIKRSIHYLVHDRWQFIDSFTRTFLQWLPDKYYISIRYKCHLGNWINWNNPISFNEKINWLKLFNRKPEYTTMVDKYAVKEYVEKRIGTQYVIPTIGVWEHVETIEWEKLPQQFVLKTTHDGGGIGVVICSSKDTFDYNNAVKRLQASLKNDVYKNYREWPYKNVKKRIVAETFITSTSGELKDYKFFCFNGKVRCFKIDFNRFTNHQANYYSPTGALLPFGECSCPPDSNHLEQLPTNLHEMIDIAERLSKGHPFLRVDLYNVDGKIYFSELTFSPASGMGRFTDDEWDITLGEWLMLPQAKVQ